MGYYMAAGDYGYSAAGGWGSKLLKKGIRAVGKYGKYVPIPAVQAAARVAKFATPFLKTGGKLAAGAAVITAAGVGTERALATQPQAVMPGGSPMAPMPGLGGAPWLGKKRRHTNPLNPKALRRAMARTEAFRRFAKRSGACPTPRRSAPARGCAKCGTARC